MCKLSARGAMNEENGRKFARLWEKYLTNGKRYDIIRQVTAHFAKCFEKI